MKNHGTVYHDARLSKLYAGQSRENTTVNDEIGQRVRVIIEGETFAGVVTGTLEIVVRPECCPECGSSGKMADGRKSVRTIVTRKTGATKYRRYLCRNCDERWNRITKG